MYGGGFKKNFVKTKGGVKECLCLYCVCEDKGNRGETGEGVSLSLSLFFFFFSFIYLFFFVPFFLPLLAKGRALPGMD